MLSATLCDQKHASNHITHALCHSLNTHYTDKKETRSMLLITSPMLSVTQIKSSQEERF